MSQKRTPDYLRREKGPTIGCADVTIVSVAAITGFVILILILSRADFSNVVETFGRTSTPPVAAAQATPDRTATPRVVFTPTPLPSPTLAPTATPIPKKAVLKTNCNLRPEPSVNRGTKGEFRPGITFVILSSPREAEGIRWINVQIDDGSKNQGWMWESCFEL